jgi:hypothetical protein
MFKRTGRGGGGGGRKRKLDKIASHSLFPSIDIFRVIKESEVGEACSTHERREVNGRLYLVRQPEDKRPLGGSGC